MAVVMTARDAELNALLQRRLRRSIELGSAFH
jgi:hypothetical protein